MNIMKLILKGLSSLITWIANRQLIQAGKDRAAVEGLEEQERREEQADAIENHTRPELDDMLDEL